MDPNNLEEQLLKTLISQNIYESKYNMYKSLPIYKFIKNTYLNEYNPGNITSICDVRVINKHPIDILDELLEKGHNKLLSPNLPVIVQGVGNTYTGNNPEVYDGLRDKTYVLRTNINAIFKFGNVFPLSESECAYTKLVTTIRDSKGNFLPFNKLYGFSLISVCPLSKPELNGEYKMNSTDYIKSLSIIESIFQTAIASNNKILILSLYGQHEEDQNPINDIIMIYNYCILKYSHKFTNIIIGVPEYMDTDYFDTLNDNIMKPQEITKHVDQQFESKKMQNVLLQK